MSKSISGACLCGRVKYRVHGPFLAFHLCHCSQCRRSTGSAHASNIFAEPEQIEWLAGEEFIKRYTPEEPDVISKCFCTHCGSLVPYTSLSSGKLIIPAGSLRLPDDNIYWRDRADWYDAGVKAQHIDTEPE